MRLWERLRRLLRRNKREDWSWAHEYGTGEEAVSQRTPFNDLQKRQELVSQVEQLMDEADKEEEASNNQRSEVARILGPKKEEAEE